MKSADRQRLALLSILFALDRATKSSLVGRNEIPLGSFASLQPVRNSGIAFSIPVPAVLATLIIGLVVFILLAYGVWLFRQHRTWFPWALLAVGGAANFFDRLRYGAVIDFVHLAFLPVFNLADLMIVVGLALLIWPGLTRHRAQS